ncbi:MAG: dihydrolipoamide succinyltransferase, partial [Phycisphaeraceae bacterium]|nr:dihydrolipoamide succinyltransferase [Phycisphaeraceae bacterium]
MSVEITIPSPGESISEVTVGTWMKQTGDWVDKDEILLEIESDKATLEITSPASGVLSATGETGAELAVGVVIGSIDTDAEKPAGGAAAPTTEAEPAATAAPAETAATNDDVKATPVAKKLAADEGIDLGTLKGSGPAGRVTKSDVLEAASAKAAAPTPAAAPAPTATAPAPAAPAATPVSIPTSNTA